MQQAQAMWEQLFEMRAKGMSWEQVAQIILDVSGWSSDDPPPDLDKYIVVAAPHTDWWDGFWMVVAAFKWNLRIKWLVKQSTVYSSPAAASFLKAVGAIPVDRSAPQGLVGQLVDEFNNSESLVLAIPPEGTRGKRDTWKSGFYHIARQANVPVCLTYLDYGRRRAGFGPCFYFTDDISADMDRVRKFYAECTAKHPEKFTFPLLKEEGLTPEEARARVGL